MAQAAVRTARSTDVHEIARIQVDTWRFAYAELLPPTVLAALDVDEAAHQWAATVQDGPALVYVATEGGATVGFCAAGLAPESEVVGAQGELPADAASVGLVSTLLVEPRWARRGHGGRLLAAAAAQLRERGAGRGVCW